MTITLTASTRSGSTYTLDDTGIMKVTRRKGHPLPTSERFAVESIQRIAGPKGTTLLVVTPVDGQMFTTSGLATATLPRCLRTVGGTWLREDQVVPPKEPAAPSKSLDDRLHWTPASTVEPFGLAAALAVYGD